MDRSAGEVYPVLPLRDIVVFPHMIVPLFVGRERSVRALEDVMKDDKQILLIVLIKYVMAEVFFAIGDVRLAWFRVQKNSSDF